MSSQRPHRPPLRYRLLIGVGGLGSGMFFALEGDHDLGRNESRSGRLLDVRDYCKLHIISHYVAVLLRAAPQRPGLVVLPVGVLGDDAPGERLRKEMAEAGMDLRFVRTAGDRSSLLSICFQYPDGSGGNITTSDSAAAALRSRDVDKVEPMLAQSRGACLALAVPEAPLEARDRLLHLAGGYGAFRVASVTSAEVPRAIAIDLFSQVDLLAINEDEAAAIAGGMPSGEQAHLLLDACAARLVASNPAMRIVVTMGSRGAHGYSDGRWDYCPAADVDAVGTAGAGDALLAGVLIGLAGGLPLVGDGPGRMSFSERPLDSALDLGTLLAGFSVTSLHTIHPEADRRALSAFAESLGASMSPEMANLLSGPAMCEGDAE